MKILIKFLSRDKSELVQPHWGRGGSAGVSSVGNGWGGKWGQRVPWTPVQGEPGSRTFHIPKEKCQGISAPQDGSGQVGPEPDLDPKPDPCWERRFRAFAQV